MTVSYQSPQTLDRSMSTLTDILQKMIEKEPNVGGIQAVYVKEPLSKSCALRAKDFKCKKEACPSHWNFVEEAPKIRGEEEGKKEAARPLSYSPNG